MMLDVSWQSKETESQHVPVRQEKGMTVCVGKNMHPTGLYCLRADGKVVS